MPTSKKSTGLSLATRIFLITASLLVLSVGAAVVVTYLLGNRIARDAVKERLQASNSLQSTSRQQRIQYLQLGSTVFATDAGVRAYIAEGAATGDVASLLDLLAERQSDLAFDFAIVLDPQGKVLARTDEPAASGQDLSPRPLVAMAIEKNQAAGVWQEGERLYDAVAVPVIQDFILQGFVVAAFALNNERALEVKRASGTEVAFLAATPAGPVVSASTLDASAAARLIAALRAEGGTLRLVMEQGEAKDQINLQLQDGPWVALLSPLRDAADKPIGASVALASFDREFATYRRIGIVLAAVGLGSMLLAGVLSFTFSRRALRPIAQLADAAEAARQGNYGQRLRIERGDEVGRLATTFDGLLAELREKRDMEAYVADLSRNLPDASGSGDYEAPAAHRVTLLAIELRSYSNRRVVLDPAATLDRLGRDLRRITAGASSRRGKVEGTFGHRVLLSFDGDGRAFNALQAAAEILVALSQTTSAFDADDPPLAAIASGEAVSGTVAWGESTAPAVVGLPVQQLESLLREASPGDILLAQDVHTELQETFERAGVELRPQRGLVSTQPLFLLRPEVAARITGVEISSSASTLLTELPEVTPGQTLSGIAPGSLLGERFQILSVLGAGGMGVVYKARDRELDEIVALKMMKREVTADPGLLERLKSELKLARKITHPNVLRTFDFGDVNGMPYISMEYVRGVTLRYLLDREGRLPFSAALRVAKQLAAGLAAAHAQNVIHRDIKPENLIIDHAGNGKLMDFGIARPVQRMTPGQTQAGWIVGTPQYLAPEQLEGKEADTRADIYACGVVLFEMFTGKLPFEGDNPVQIILKHLNEAPPKPSTLWPDIGKDLEALILRCLEKDRERRPKSAQELLVALEGLSV
jgi:eukaryotic-like serine/threonine-protein kinase